MEINKIYCMDCLDSLKLLPDIPDLIICDPPYEFENKGGGLYNLPRTKKMLKKISDIGTHTFEFEKFIPKILDIQDNRVNAYFFCNKKLLPLYLQEIQKRELLFDVLVFRKLNPLPAFNNSHMNDLEYIVFVRSPKVYFSSKEGYRNYSKHYAENIGHHGLIHPNQKPIELIRRFIRISSKKGHLVFDCFAGSGTTGVACKQLGRNFILIEKNAEYCKIAEERLAFNTIQDFESQETLTNEY